jgi:hypothetical protein
MVNALIGVEALVSSKSGLKGGLKLTILKVTEGDGVGN